MNLLNLNWTYWKLIQNLNPSWRDILSWHCCTVKKKSVLEVCRRQEKKKEYRSRRLYWSVAVFLQEIFIFLVGGLTRGLVEIISRTLAANDVPHLTSLFSPFDLAFIFKLTTIEDKRERRELGICDLWWNIFFAPSIASDQMGCYGLVVL